MKYIASWSGGKDSTASIILAHEHNDPLDEVIYVEVMFDKDTSGEIPEHRDFIYNVAIPQVESWGYPVTILRSDRTYLDCFYHKLTKGKRVGMTQGFPMQGKCKINSDCKMRPIQRYMKSQPKNLIQYVGIAADEPKRLARLEDYKVSLLTKYNYTEQMAFELCKKYNLLSPIYEFTKRGGCFFCMNARDCELKHLRDNHSELWNKLLSLEDEENLAGPIWNTRTQTSLHDKEEQFYWEGQQISIFDFMED
jgi:hypothetical protein